MCLHRKEVCRACKCPIHDMIMLCENVRLRLKLRNPIMHPDIRMLTYTPENVAMITEVYPHEIPTVERNSSMCRNHYLLTGAGVHMSYEQYRSSTDAWMKT